MPEEFPFTVTLPVNRQFFRPRNRAARSYRLCYMVSAEAIWEFNRLMTLRDSSYKPLQHIVKFLLSRLDSANAESWRPLLHIRLF